MIYSAKELLEKLIEIQTERIKQYTAPEVDHCEYKEAKDTLGWLKSWRDCVADKESE